MKTTKKAIKEEMELVLSVGRRCEISNDDIWYNGLSFAMERGHFYGHTKKEIIDEAYQSINVKN